MHELEVVLKGMRPDYLEVLSGLKHRAGPPSVVRDIGNMLRPDEECLSALATSQPFGRGRRARHLAVLTTERILLGAANGRSGAVLGVAQIALDQVERVRRWRGLRHSRIALEGTPYPGMSDRRLAKFTRCKPRDARAFVRALREVLKDRHTRV